MEPLTESWKNTSIPEMEKNAIEYWRSISAIRKIIDKSKDCPPLIFIDGPPFANGIPHWGHLLVSTVKDTMTRFFTMGGYNVDRGFGFDTHGVPMEMQAKKDIGYTTKQELLQYGIDRHNDVCRKMVSDCSERWQKDFERLGRWVDPAREYKTMDKTYMESVVWVFKELYQKGMIYEGYKVMPYSTGCTTPLSHFEAKQNYKQVSENTIVCCFEVISTEESIFKVRTDGPTYILAWTTTPWTLPSNMALCTGMNIEIVYIYDNQNKCYYLLSNSKYEESYKKNKYNNISRFLVVERFSSYDLINCEYRPPFTWFWNPEENEKININERPFRVIADNYVKDCGEGSGTGFVHISPSHGEEDFRVACQNNIINKINSKKNIINLINDEGRFTHDAHEYAGKYIKEADPLIIRELKSKGLAFDIKSYTHSYPYCYRTDTPLIYRLVSGWFIKASDPIFREKMLANNAKINWMPPGVGKNDFDNWLATSVDWCISRSRYWGTPIPIWKSDDGSEVVCVGSIKELEELSGVPNIADLHIEFVDKIKIPSKTGRGMLSRVEGVLDCWFESGSAPYGQLHYPFESAEKLHLEKPYIADFITESKDQTRGWFYTLTVLATALFNKPAFKNVIVTGLINGSDGAKMSKSKKNYQDPNFILDKYGSDAVRLYLLSTPVVKAESIKFDDTIIEEILQKTIVKIYNIAILLVDKINLYNKQFTEPIKYPTIDELSNLNELLDRWIVNKTGILAREISEDFMSYRANNVAQKLLNYIEQFANWYVKMAREHLKGPSSRYNISDSTWKQSIQTLLFVVYQFIRISAPVIPFITEKVYQMIRPFLPLPLESVHFEKYPEQKEFVLADGLENKFAIIQKVILIIREIRYGVKMNLRRPVVSAEIGCANKEDWIIIQDVLDYVTTECNVMNVKQLNLDGLIKSNIQPVMDEIKQYLINNNRDLKYIKNIVKFITSMTMEQLSELQSIGFIEEPTNKITINKNFVNVNYLLTTNDKSYKTSDGIVIKLDLEYSEEVEKEHLIRIINRAIQMHRKQRMFKVWDIVEIIFDTNSDKLKTFILNNMSEFICQNTTKISCEDLANRPHTTHEIDIIDANLLLADKVV